jgi:hypothetical protein
MNDVPVLDRIRTDLVSAIDADLGASRSDSRRRVAVAATLALSLASAGTVAAATGLWSGPPAPPEAQQDLAGLGRSFPGAGDIQLDQGIEVARSDHHVLYAAPTSGGGFCVTVDADHGTGGCSTPIAANAPLAYVAEGGPGRTGQDDPGLGGGYGGGSTFGRVQDPAAVTVDIGLAGAVTAVTARVGTNGFFIVDLPESAWKAMFPESGNTHPLGPATAYDAKGQAVATSP